MEPVLSEKAYEQLVEQTYKRLLSAFDEFDADEVDVERAGDVIHLRFASGQRAVLNTQRPVKQLWFAAAGRAWHFSWDDGLALWLDDKGTGQNLLVVVSDITHAQLGKRPAL